MTATNEDPAVPATDGWNGSTTAMKPAAAMAAWAQHLVSRRLRAQRVSARDLRVALGGSESGWRNKLNGTRPFALDDLLRITVALDPGLLASLPFSADRADAFFPPPYRALLTHVEMGRGMPRFEARAVDRGQAMRSLHEWLDGEIASGRGWLMSEAVLCQRLLVAAEHAGLASISATMAARGDNWLEIAWIHPSVRLRVLYAGLPGSTPTTAAVQSDIIDLARGLVGISESHADTKVLVAVAPNPVLTTVASVLGTESLPGVDGWVTCSLGQFHRLGVPMSETTMPTDMQLRTLATDSANRLGGWLLK